jgi:hypothetical protein
MSNILKYSHVFCPQERKSINIFIAYIYIMSSDERKTGKKYDKYSKKLIESDSKLDLSSTLTNSLYKLHELIMK